MNHRRLSAFFTGWEWDSGKMRKWKLVVGVFLVFSAGMLVGSFVAGWGIHHFFERFKNDSEYRVDVVLSRLSRRLDLNPEQRDKIQAILNEADWDLHQYWITVLSGVDQKVNRARAKIAKELDSDQAARFKEFNTQINRKRQSKSVSTPAPAENTP
jgi:hypothetical protein